MTLYTIWIYIFLMGGSADTVQLVHQPFKDIQACYVESKVKAKVELDNARANPEKRVSGIATICVKEGTPTND